ncbi:MAG TPA: hypothetical protein VKB67_13905 [Rhizomicrobium sp.]|nr:hypothetical protein [Rhizomicrobium sp.]
MTKNVEVAIRLRSRSEEIRIMAEDMKSLIAKEFLIGLAAEYLKTAEMVDKLPDAAATLMFE